MNKRVISMLLALVCVFSLFAAVPAYADEPETPPTAAEPTTPEESTLPTEPTTPGESAEPTEPTEPTPSAEPTPTPTPAPTPEPTPMAPAPVIYKQPTGESHYIGESALFIANADAFTAVSWTAVAPNGMEMDMQTFRNTFPNSSTVGDTTGSLTINNINMDMNGWTFYCTFDNMGSTTSTNSVALRVLGPKAQTPNQNVIVPPVTNISCPICGSTVASNVAICPVCGEYINSDGIDYSYADAYRDVVDDAGDIWRIYADGSMDYLGNIAG